MYFLCIIQICKQKPAIHMSLICYCDHRMIQTTAPFCCFAANLTHYITLIFLQQRMTVIGDAFLMTMVSGNLARHSVATYLRCKQAAYKNRIQILGRTSCKITQYILFDTIHVLIVMSYFSSQIVHSNCKKFIFLSFLAST